MQQPPLDDSRIADAQQEDTIREGLLAKALLPVAAELRLVDLHAFARHILGEEEANLTDLVESSSELFFREGTLIYASKSEIDLSWGGEIAVNLSLNFNHGGVSVLFDLILLPINSAVSIKYIAFDALSDDPHENTTQLREALQDARLR